MEQHANNTPTTPGERGNCRQISGEPRFMGRVSGQALSWRMLVGALGFSPDLDRFREMQGAGFGGDSERNRPNENCFGGREISIPREVARHK